MPLFLETISGIRQASYTNGGFLPHPLFHPRLGAKQLRSIESLVLKMATDRLAQYGASRWLCVGDPLSIGTDAIEDQLLARSGVLDVSLQCHIMDLTQADQDLWRQIRHSSKSIINEGLKTYEFNVYVRTNYTDLIGERHRLLHHKASGRITRPIPTFHKMYSWIDEGCGLMFEQTYGGTTVRMIFVALGNRTACGASAADDPDFQPPVPLTHSMNYFIYEDVQKRGFKFYDVGETT